MMFTSRLTVFAMCVTILKAENSGDSSVLILAQIHVPKHFCEGSTPFLKHACYEQCLLLKGRAQWEAAGPGGSCCVEGLVEGRLGTLSECRRADCAISQSSQYRTSLSHTFPLISAIPLEGMKHSQARTPLHKVRSSFQQEEASKYPDDRGLVLSILFLLLICFDCGKVTGKE